MLSDAFRCFQMLSDAFRCFQMLSDAFRCFQMLSDAEQESCVVPAPQVQLVFICVHLCPSVVVLGYDGQVPNCSWRKFSMAVAAKAWAYSFGCESNRLTMSLRGGRRSEEHTS